MKKLGSLLLAIVLVAGVLIFVKADVNHGHGPAHGEDAGESVTTDPGEAPAAH